MTRFNVRFLLVVGGLFVLVCIGQAVPIQLAFYLLFGWIFYLNRVWPQVRIDISGVATGLICVVLLTAGLHRFLRWLYSHTGDPWTGDSSVSRRWRKRWTAWLISAILLMFVAGLATVGVTHQVGWLLTADKVVVGGSSGPAVQRAQSTNNLKQMGLALYNYSPDHDAFPPAATIDRLGRPLFGWQAMILPFIDHAQLHDQIDFQVPWDDPRNAGPYRTPVNEYLRPGIDQEKDANGYAVSHYAGNALVLAGVVARTLADVSDGGAYTIRAGEVASHFKPWGDPINWRDPALGINQGPYGFGSPAPGGASFLFVDGSVRFLKETINPRVLQALSTPAGGEKVSDLEY